jgi:cytidylate kinase
MKTQLIIAIDGPSASGKGTLAKKIARHFNLAYLNTGALYRLVAFRMQNQKISTELFLENISQLVKNITEAELENEELFSEEVGALASVIAREKKLREALVVFQKDFIKAGENGVVLDGRDTTTVICPDADFKFFVTADVEIRAKRRFEQLQKKGDVVSYAEILAQLKKRDENDLNRQDSPLKVAQGAVVIDNGNLTIEQGFEIMLASVTG